MNEIRYSDLAGKLHAALHAAGELDFFELEEAVPDFAALSDEEQNAVLNRMIDDGLVGTLWGGGILFIPLGKEKIQSQIE